ncbi:MAG: serpin family protein [Gammaproteobacteria bacterium]|nr:serpin family protein [Gammaproteobacteria bacterium]
MRRYTSVLSFLPAACVAALIGCGLPDSDTDPAAHQQPEHQQPVSTDLHISLPNTTLGFELLRWAHDQGTDPNLLLSPLSVSIALAMTANGAHGDTLEAMHTTLGLAGHDAADINSAYRRLIDQLRALDADVEFRLANSLWARDGVAFEAPFLQASRRHFDAEVTALDFTDPAAPNTINQWVDEVTGGRIETIVERLGALDVLLLLNAVYFSAPWSDPFMEGATQPMDFETLDGSVRQVPTMMRDAMTYLRRDDDMTVIELPYAGGAFAMTLLMPHGGETLDDLVASLTPESWAEAVGPFTRERVLLRLPKFRFASDTRLGEVLKAQGMSIAFDASAADFRRMSTSFDDLHVSDVRHKAFIDVHELGTEAAAVTSVTVSVTAMPPEIRIDRPFVFAIRDRETDTLLFIGRIGDPSAQ